MLLQLMQTDIASPVVVVSMCAVVMYCFSIYLPPHQFVNVHVMPYRNEKEIEFSQIILYGPYACVPPILLSVSICRSKFSINVCFRNVCIRSGNSKWIFTTRLQGLVD